MYPSLVDKPLVKILGAHKPHISIKDFALLRDADNEGKFASRLRVGQEELSRNPFLHQGVGSHPHYVSLTTRDCG